MSENISALEWFFRRGDKKIELERELAAANDKIVEQAKEIERLNRKLKSYAVAAQMPPGLHP